MPVKTIDCGSKFEVGLRKYVFLTDLRAECKTFIRMNRVAHACDKRSHAFDREMIVCNVFLEFKNMVGNIFLTVTRNVGTILLTA